jgi:tetratricopeptide (TPR) repeat protein
MLDIQRVRDAIDQAYRHSRDLPERDRLRIRAFREEVYENDNDAEQLYRTLVANYPDDVEGWHSLGQWQLFSAPRRGRSPSESRDALERALSLDPNEWQAIFHLVALAAFEKKYDELQTLAPRLTADGEIPIYGRADLAFKIGDTTAQERMLEELSTLGDHMLIICVVNVATNTGDPARARDAARLLSESQRSNEVRGFGHIIIAYLEAARGRWQSAKQELVAAEALNPALAIEYRALLATAPFLPVQDDELRLLRDAVAAWDPEKVPPSDNPAPWLSVHDDAHAHLRVYLLGLLSVRLSEYEGALEYAAELERMDGPSHVTGLMRDLAHGLRARVAWRQGRLDEALAEFQRTRLRSPARYRLYSPFYKEQRERYLRADLLREMGRDEEALGWTSSFGIGWHFDTTYIAPLCLHRADYYAKLGQRGMAAEEYAKFIDFWKDCDEELRPIADEARRRLDALTASAE